MLGLAIKSTSLARVAASLVETYLGRDAGRRVLAGRMSRGSVDKIHAVLWFSDIRGYTALSEDMASDQLIPLLDDYAEAVISAVHGAGGDVLKLIGDGVLAIFAADDPAAASRSALQAEAALQLNLAALKERRAAAQMPVASIYVGIHIGDVFYGNIGSKDRLDFTVVGEAVNETSRISSMCSSVGRDDAVLVRLFARPCRTRTSRSWCRSAATRCAGCAGRRSCSRSIRKWPALPSLPGF